MALPATMISAYRPLAENILLLDVAKKDSTGTFERRHAHRILHGFQTGTIKINPESATHLSIRRLTVDKRKTAEEANKARR
jgi:hypothetical protein